MPHQLEIDFAVKTTSAYWAKIPTTTLAETRYADMSVRDDLVEGGVFGRREVQAV
jgi:hypothetical protein